MAGELYLTAKEAAERLGVSVASLYAYVSRGLIPSHARDASRRRWYLAADVEALLARTQGVAREERTAGGFSWGEPVLDSALTAIQDGKLYYRGHDAARLAERASLAEVARLLWRGEAGAVADPFAAAAPTGGAFAAARAATAGLSPLERCQSLLALVAGEEPAAANTAPVPVMRTAALLMRWAAALMTHTRRPPGSEPLHRQLAMAWGLEGRDEELLRAALVLSADHELNASAFAVRVVAATGAPLAAALTAGFAALQGPRHGGMTGRIMACLPEWLAAGDPRVAMAARLKRGEELPGFGHPLYPAGDPRWFAIARLAAREKLERWPRMLEIAAAGELMTGAKPSLDMALCLLSVALGLPQEAPVILFALGRMAGWSAHALEQYAEPGLIRPRARYRGPAPRD
jgi:citrate synthase